jgi:hypothetical protein
MKLRMLAAAAVAAGAILGVAGGASASNANFWTDPAGDSGSAADVTRIDVSNDDAGNITFQVTYGNRPDGLTDQDEVHIWIDSDANPSTGDSYGYDYVIALAKGGAVLKHSTAAGLEDTPSSTFTASPDGTRANVNHSELANTAKFVFYVATITLIDDSIDYLPDGNQVGVYSLTAPRPTKVTVVFAPKTPKAGTRFLATVALAQLENGSSLLAPSVACKGTLNGKPIRATAIPGACVWKLPKSAKGKRFAFTIVVDNHGSKGTFGPWKFNVR